MSGMSMRGSDWKPLHGVDQRRLSEARLQAHYAVQWLARAARAYVPPQPDDGHTNLGWARQLVLLVRPRNGVLWQASTTAPTATRKVIGTGQAGRRW